MKCEVKFTTDTCNRTNVKIPAT